MKKVDKNTAMLFLVLLCFIIGGSLSFESLARFSKKFEADKSISTAKFEVNAVNTFNDVENAIPGEEPIAEDKITLSNENDYPVEFTVKLKSENKDESKNLLQFLNLTITIDNEVKEIQDEYVIRLEPNTVKDIFAKIEWRLDENGEIDAEVASEATAVYSYDIKAKQLTNDNSGGVNNGGESTEGDNSNNGNNGNGSSGTENTNSRILYESKYSDFNSGSEGEIIDGWTAASNEKQNLIYVDNGSLVLGTKCYTDLDINDFNLNNENLEFKINAQLIESDAIKDVGRGVNLGVNIRKDINENSPYEFTYQLYKVKGEDKVYIKNVHGNNSSSSLITEMQISNDGSIEKNNLELSGKIYLDSGNIKCNMKAKESTVNESIVIEKNMTGRKYEEGSKLYFNIGNIAGKEGIKINSMEVKAVPKE